MEVVPLFLGQRKVRTISKYKEREWGFRMVSHTEGERWVPFLLDDCAGVDVAPLILGQKERWVPFQIEKERVVGLKTVLNTEG